jgi:hypothetical protein
VQNKQSVTEFSETFLMFFKQFSIFHPIPGVFMNILSSWEKRNRSESLILSGYENNAIDFGSLTAESCNFMQDTLCIIDQYLTNIDLTHRMLQKPDTLTTFGRFNSIIINI